ncbi:MAG: hypothetical protein AAF899_13885 [Pseudomonadota bacterium]
MDVIADGMLIATALVAALYCAVLSSRLRRLARSDDGLGGQIGALAAAVDEARGALTDLQAQATTLRRETSAASDRLRRESSEARRLSEGLEQAMQEARKLLDEIESTPMPLPQPAASLPLTAASEAPPSSGPEVVSPDGQGPAPTSTAGEPVEDSEDDSGGYEVVTGSDALAAIEAALSGTAADTGSGAAPQPLNGRAPSAQKSQPGAPDPTAPEPDAEPDADPKGAEPLSQANGAIKTSAAPDDVGVIDVPAEAPSPAVVDAAPSPRRLSVQRFAI